MAGYNVCISLSQDGLNQGSQAVYARLHGAGKVFVGSAQIERDGIAIDAKYDCTQAPVFNLSPQPTGAVADALLSAAEPALGGADAEAARALVTYAAGVASSFSVTFPALRFTFSSQGVQPVDLSTDITVLCTVTVDGGKVSFAAISATAPKQPTVGAQFVMDTFILPTIKASANQLFAGLTIPPLAIPGVALTAPDVAIANGRLYAAALLAGQGTPALPSTGVPGPNSSFFMLLDQAAMQAAASYAVGQSGTFHKSDESGSSGFNAHYDFSYRLHDPQVSLDGTSLNIGFQLAGSVSAGVHVFWVPIGLGYEAVAAPDPAATCALVPDGGQLRIVERSLKPFTLLVKPTGSIPSQVLSWMTEFIVQGVVAALTPLVTAFLKDIDFSTLQVPSFTESIAGEGITITPADLSVQSVSGQIALAGRLDYS